MARPRGAACRGRDVPVSRVERTRAGERGLLVAPERGLVRQGRSAPLLRSDINLFCYCDSVIDLDAEVSDGTLDLQERDCPQITGPRIKDNQSRA